MNIFRNIFCSIYKNIMLNKICENIHPNFYCEVCDYKCYKKSSWSQHILTQKHQNSTECYINATECYINATNNKNTCLCGKKFKHHSSYYRHKKTCDNNPDLEKEIHEEPPEKPPEKPPIEQITENHDLIQYLINENKDFKNLILEVCKNFQGTNIMTNSHNVSNVNSHNKTFNLQFFLNETCKDAMNMSDFIDSMKLQLSDLESVGKLGFVDGISNIIIKNLEALDVEKRPVHCSDSKRETMYIKEHDKWEKEDNELKRMKDLVRNVRDRNISLIATWRDLYPECVKSNSKKTTQFNQICMEAFGGETGGEKGTKQEKEDKIISKIAKAMVIDKKD